ncbi:TPA: hypothetical protein HMV82_19515 [Escherichia coli]|jgi:hypothetical protein|uniref:Uncharacterized protein n=10 Tax=Enterobacteriaceae TaxID=543 RepID=A0AB34RZ38_CITFR|nr:MULTISPECIES: hypothetical protein [Enterobacteriaceae]AIX52525.1 hypothetical protein PSNIH1_20125 [Pantoea sp. PSNIH1]AIX76432.1 hypothetical protein PSNIH2_22120 [Pantoea sp. PSNIH2]AUV04725.1 hypothetical protein C2U51_28085 [Enterobacteriaceae bacterium ENNIH1]EAA7458935.1 hypothetical protein [Salmonella enterica subsp. enterica serovar Havana]EAB6151826.1 hypothetical protein [Salmonella enterica]EBC9802044.1 hypothetical protein [Salmonella enterica subsp. enterica serovar Senftenb
MSKETLSLATRYAGNSSVISEMQTALDVMPLVTEAVQSVCERVECEPTEFLDAMALVKRFLLAKQDELRAESVSIRKQLGEMGE